MRSDHQIEVCFRFHLDSLYSVVFFRFFTKSEKITTAFVWTYLIWLILKLIWNIIVISEKRTWDDHKNNCLSSKDVYLLIRPFSIMENWFVFISSLSNIIWIEFLLINESTFLFCFVGLLYESFERTTGWKFSAHLT